MKKTSPQTTSSTPPAPSGNAPASAPKQPSRTDQEAHKIGDELADAARKKLRDEIEEKVSPQPKTGS